MALTFDNAEIRNGAFTLDADWSVQAGTRLGLIGPSGAGKSTLLMGLAGFLPVTRGRILWQGKDITAADPGDRPLTILFQAHNLFPHLDAAANVGLGIDPGLRLRAEDRERVNDTLAQLGLDGLAGRRPHELSGGQQGRVALARALVRNRPLLLLDEPFAALGPALKAELLELVADLCDRHGTTLVMVSHDPSDIRRICPLASVVAHGTAATPVDTGDLLDTPPAALRDYLGQG